MSLPSSPTAGSPVATASTSTTTTTPTAIPGTKTQDGDNNQQQREVDPVEERAMEEEEDLMLEDLGLNAAMTAMMMSGGGSGMNTSQNIPVTLEQAATIGKQIVKEFLTLRTCYDAMALSAKVVVFDCNISLRLIAQSMEEHEVQCAPLWNPHLQRLVGIVSLAEIAEIYRHATECGEKLDIFDVHSPLSWRVLLQSIEKNAQPTAERGSLTAASFAKARRRRGVSVRTRFLTVSPETTLLDSVALLLREKAPQVSVVDEQCQTCYYVQTLGYVLEYLVRRFRDDRNLFDQSVMDLHIGTFTNIVSATVTDSFATVLALCEDNNLHDIPLLDSNNNRAVVDVFRRNWASRFVSHNLATPAPTQPVVRALDALGEEFHLPRPVTCAKSLATVRRVMVLMNEAKSNCVYIVGDVVDGKEGGGGPLLGVCSVSDVFAYFCATGTSPKALDNAR